MRRRYIAVKIVGDHEFEEGDFYDAVWASILRLFGEYGASQAGLLLVDYDRVAKQAILRCSREALDLVKASTVAITAIRNAKATVHIVSVSGTLRALRKKVRNPKSIF